MKFSYAVSALIALLSSPAVRAEFPDTVLNSAGNNEKKNDSGVSNDEEVEIIVEYWDKKGREKAKGMAKDKKFKHDVPSLKTVSFRGNRGQMKKLQSDPDIKFVEESQIFNVLGTIRGTAEYKTDILSSSIQRELAEQEPYGIGRVQADQVEQGTTNIKICVVDTGYNIDHEDLPDNSTNGFSIDGFNYVSGSTNQNWNMDGHGHGSHCAGTIGAIGNNGKGVTSVNPDPSKFSFYIGKGVSDSGSGTTMTVKEAVQSCIANNAKVVSMSLGGGGKSSIDESMYKNFYDNNDVLFIAAAGNDGNANYGYPASYPAVMSVAASDMNDVKAYFSQYNDQVEIAAPGVTVLSTTKGMDGYASWQGTSMACPHVAGVAALVWSNFPDCKNWQIRNVLLKTAKKVSGMTGATCTNSYGHGIVQAKAAYDLLASEGCDAGGSSSQVPEPEGGCAQLSDNNGSPPTPSQTLPNPFSWALEVFTDYWPEETKVSFDYENGNIDTLGYGYFSGALTKYTFSAAWPSQYCYTITISDSYGDGIYFGWYKLTVNGNVVKNYEGGEFFSEQTMSFGNGCSATTTSSIESNDSIEVREEPKGGNKEGPKANSAQSNNFVVVFKPVEDEDENL